MKGVPMTDNVVSLADYREQVVRCAACGHSFPAAMNQAIGAVLARSPNADVLCDDCHDTPEDTP